MRELEWLELGPVPYDETALQVGEADGLEIRAQACIYQRQLERLYPGARFRVKAYDHDFGTYYEVCVGFDQDSETQTTQAFKIEANLPQFWDTIAEKENNTLLKEVYA